MRENLLRFHPSTGFLKTPHNMQHYHREKYFEVVVDDGDDQRILQDTEDSFEDGEERHDL